MSQRTIKVSEFKAKCLALMDEINETGETLSITKNGKVVAQLLPAPGRRKSPFGMHAGQGHISGDISGPFHEEWGREP